MRDVSDAAAYWVGRGQHQRVRHGGAGPSAGAVRELLLDRPHRVDAWGGDAPSHRECVLKGAT